MSKLIVFLVIPVQRIVLDFRAHGFKIIPELHPNILQEMAGSLDMADICRVILRADIVVLQDTCHVEEVYE